MAGDAAGLCLAAAGQSVRRIREPSKAARAETRRRGDAETVVGGGGGGMRSSELYRAIQNIRPGDELAVAVTIVHCTGGLGTRYRHVTYMTCEQCRRRLQDCSARR